MGEVLLDGVTVVVVLVNPGLSGAELAPGMEVVVADAVDGKLEGATGPTEVKLA